MNRYFKVISNDYLISVGIDNWTGETITEEEYNFIKTIIDNKPADTETHYYMLRNDTLGYELLERPQQEEVINE